MEEIHLSGLSGESSEARERGEISETLEIVEDNHKCYSKCVDDAWDMKSEKTCAAACGL